MIRDGWTTVPLEELCHFRLGAGSPRSIKGTVMVTFPLSSLVTYRLPGDWPRTADREQLDQHGGGTRLRAKPVQPGATVFEKIGEALKAERLRLAVETYGDGQQPHGRNSQESADAKFLYYLMGTVGLSDWAEGSALPFLRQGDLARIPVVIPIHLDEQRRIAAVLGALDDLIQSNRRVADDALRLARQLALRASEIVPLTALAVAESPRLMKPTGPFEHFSLPAYDDDGLTKVRQWGNHQERQTAPDRAGGTGISTQPSDSTGLDGVPVEDPSGWRLHGVRVAAWPTGDRQRRSLGTVQRCNGSRHRCRAELRARLVVISASTRSPYLPSL